MQSVTITPCLITFFPIISIRTSLPTGATTRSSAMHVRCFGSRVALATVLLVASAHAERCATTTLVLHCTARCAGLNATSAVSSNPPPEQLLEPASVEVLAQLENDAVESHRRNSNGGSLVFAQLDEAPAQSGSPTVPSVPNDRNFSETTTYAPTHRAFSPEQLMALVGPAAALEWTPLRRATFGCVDGRQVAGAVQAFQAVLHPAMRCL